MQRRGVWRAILLSCVLMPFTAGSAMAYCSTIGLPADRKVAELATSHGEICIELLDGVDEAPGHVENFLWYLENGHLDGTFFHRLVDDFVLQGADFRYDEGVGISRTAAREGVEVTNEPCTLDTPAVNPTTCSERGNEAYTVALAKVANMPDSGSTSWFINLTDNRGNLDQQNGGFSVFGRLLDAASRQVVDDIATFGTFTDGSTMLEDADFLWIDQGLITLFEQPAPLLFPLVGVSYEPEGCADMAQLSTVLQDGYLDNPLFELIDEDVFPYFNTVSATCGTPIEGDLVDFVPQPGPGSCPDLDRVGIKTIQPSTENGLNPYAPVPPAYVSFTCEQLEAATTDRDAWRDRERATFFGDFTESSVIIESTTVRIAVPEPGQAVTAIAALMTVGWLARHRRTARRT